MSSGGILTSVFKLMGSYSSLITEDRAGCEEALIGGFGGSIDASWDADWSDIANRRKLTQTYLVYCRLTYVPLYLTVALAGGWSIIVALLTL